MDDKYFEIYREIQASADKLRKYYDIGKVKDYSVYVWISDEDYESNPKMYEGIDLNVFDIQADRLVFYNGEKYKEIKEEAIPIINEIQDKLKKMEKYLKERVDTNE